MDELMKAADFETTQYIIVSVGSELFGIDINYIDNIVRMQNITRVPKVAKYLKGVINLRGEVIPVMSLRLKLELPDEEYTNATRIIILKLEQHEPIGIIVDSVKEVVNLDSEHIEKANYDKGEHGNYLMAIGKYDDKLISLLDLNAIIVDKNE